MVVSVKLCIWKQFGGAVHWLREKKRGCAMRAEEMVPVTNAIRMEVRKSAVPSVLMVAAIALLLGSMGMIHVHGEAFKSGESLEF